MVRCCILLLWLTDVLIFLGGVLIKEIRQAGCDIPIKISRELWPMRYLNHESWNIIIITSRGPGNWYSTSCEWVWIDSFHFWGWRPSWNMKHDAFRNLLPFHIWSSIWHKSSDLRECKSFNRSILEVVGNGALFSSHHASCRLYFPGKWDMQCEMIASWWPMNGIKLPDVNSSDCPHV